MSTGVFIYLFFAVMTFITYLIFAYILCFIYMFLLKNKKNKKILLLLPIACVPCNVSIFLNQPIFCQVFMSLLMS